MTFVIVLRTKTSNANYTISNKGFALGGFRLKYRLPKRDEIPDADNPMREGVVAYLDALGTKGVWARTSPKTIINDWQEIIRILDESVKKAPKELGDEDLHEKLEYNVTAFSDTIVISIYCFDPPSAIPLMVEIISDAFLFAINNGIFFRGVISTGIFCHTKSLIIGPAIDEAAEFYMQADWIGISAAPSASFGLSRLETQGAAGELSKWFIKYNIPTKTSVQRNEWALSWPRKFLMQAGNANTLSSKGQLFQILSTHPISNDAMSKYRNTMDFFDFCESNNKQDTNKDL